MEKLKDYIKVTQRAREFANQRNLNDRQLEILLIMYTEKMGPMTAGPTTAEEYA